MYPVVHFEMPYDNRERMCKFYQEAFGWELQVLGPEMGHYVLATTAKADVRPDGPRGAIGGGFFQRQASMPDQYPSIVLSVADIAAATAKVKAAGGELLGEPWDIPGVGKYMSVRDTEGNRVGLLQPLPGGM